MATAEELQTLVLTTLDRDNVIADSKDLKAVNGDDLNQLSLLGVLNSLKSKEVDRALYPTFDSIRMYTERENILLTCQYSVITGLDG